MATAEQQATIDGIVRKVAGRKLAMFAAFKDVERADLVQEASLAVHKALATYDASRGALSTWAYMVASRTIIDLHRARTRTGTREAKVAKGRSLIAFPGTSPIEDDERQWNANADLFAVKQMSLPEFAREAFKQNINLGGRRRPGRGPQWYSPGLGRTLFAIKQRMDTSYRGLHRVLVANPSLRLSLRMNRIPSQKTVFNLCVKCTGVSANNSVAQAMGFDEREYMALTKEIRGLEVCSEAVAAKALNCSPITLRQKRGNGTLPPGLWRKSKITGRVEYIVGKVKELAEATN